MDELNPASRYGVDENNVLDLAKFTCFQCES